MPIYEFYCPGCNTLLSFFSARVDPAVRPRCPHCGDARLTRKPSTFATLSRRGGGEGTGEEEEGDDLFAGVDEVRLEGAMEQAMTEMEAAGEGAEEDPRQVARLLRRIGEAAGLEPGPAMEEMLHRLEAGEDPETLDESLGEDGEPDAADLFRPKRSGGREKIRRPPRVDPDLHFL